MSSNAAARAGQPAAGGTDAQRQGADWKWTLARALLMYAGVNAVTNPKSPIAGYLDKLLGREPSSSIATPAMASVSPVNAGSSVGETAASVPVSRMGATAPQINAPTNVAVPVWRDDAKLDLYVYISSGPAPDAAAIKSQASDLIPEGGVGNAPAIPFDAFDDLLHDPLHDAKRDLVAYSTTERDSQKGGQLEPIAAVKWSDIALSDTGLSRDADLVLQLDEGVRRHNGSIWADLVLTQHGFSPNPSDKMYHPLAVYRTRKLLSRLLPLKKKRAEKNLFDKQNTTTTRTTSAEHEEDDKVKIVAHWHRNLTLALVQDQGDAGVQLSQLPPPILQYVSVVRDPTTHSMVAAPRPTDPAAVAALDKASAAGRPQDVLRYPTLFPNDFWLLKEHMHPINDTITTLPLHIHLYHQSWFKFQTLAALTDSFDKQAAGGAAGSEIDMFKTMLLETNPWFLALTIIVSILHSLFEMLAFSSDVRHWRNKEDLAGVSVGSIVTNVVVQLIITLYLLDNNEDTSWMILAGQAVGVVIECWKLTKAISVSIRRNPNPNSWLVYQVNIKDKHELSQEEIKTQEFDRLAFKYTGIAIGPVLIGYTIYSAFWQTHRGWWSFLISTATSFVYAFGFVSLVPQLIVNYKLKSTAGMNSKTFIYKILGTFVDDLFAFCIKMPTLHRLACFRDDLVFFIFLYQRWIYGVDPTRRNEFGQVLQADEKHQLQQQDQEPKHQQNVSKSSDSDSQAKLENHHPLVSSSVQNPTKNLRQRNIATTSH